MTIVCVIVSSLSETPAAHLKLQYQVQPMFPQWVDGVDDQCYNNVNAI